MTQLHHYIWPFDSDHTKLGYRPASSAGLKKYQGRTTNCCDKSSAAQDPYQELPWTRGDTYDCAPYPYGLDPQGAVPALAGEAARGMLPLMDIRELDLGKGVCDVCWVEGVV